MIRGLVLAGGKSSRFGTDKALAMYDGMSFLDRAVSLLASLDLRPVVVTRPDSNYPLTDCDVIHDELPGKGPCYLRALSFRNYPKQTQTRQPLHAASARPGPRQENDGLER